MSTTIEATAAEGVARVRECYEAGDYLGAYEVAKGLGPMLRWPGAAAKTLAGRLAWQLGAIRLGLVLPMRAWREDPTDPEAAYYRARAMLARRGPLAAWRFLGRVGPLEGASDDIRSDWEATHALALAGLRDFGRATRRLDEAERMAPGRAWLRVERSSLLEAMDRYPEALAAAEESLSLRPWYRPAVQAKAHLLQLLDREADAIAYLTEADARMNSGVIVAQLANLQAEAGMTAEAAASLDRFEALSPMMDAMATRWLAGRRSDVAYRAGDLAAALEHARLAGEGFFKEVAARMEAAPADARAVRLSVPFVRQHHLTCAPATLTALARFWGRGADHLEVAEAICYDGTPDHRERSWAAANGWIPREFTVTWDAAVALLDRGVPFTLTTVEPMSAHLQAVIGYDARRGTLLIRDPSLPHEGEALAEPFLERYRSVGPRGMAMVPADRPELLDGIELPDAAPYDRLHKIQVALREHDRDAAAAELESLRAEHPDHRLTLQARRHLALYDADAPANLAALEALRERFPGDVNLRLFQLSTLRELGRRDDRLALYREACAAPNADPVLHRQYAEELLDDAREQAEAERLAMRAHRARPVDAPTISLLARLAWNADRREEALELHRFASCLADKDEWLARAYFSAARAFHREEETLALMRERVRRDGSASSAPARTLHAALDMLARADEAREVLDDALRRRPNDGELLLYAAEADVAAGEFDRAAARVEEARPYCRRGDWLRAAAGLAAAQGDLRGALELWRDVLRSEPAAIDAVRASARLIAETEGADAALDHLRAASERSPHNYLLHQALVDHLRGEGSDEAEPALRRLLDIHPASAWARRELALLLCQAGRHEEAAAEMAVASALEPGTPAEADVRGILLEQAGRTAEAREAYREAVRRDVDLDHAVARLIDTAETQAERLEAVAFVAAELERQVTYGDGLLTFARHARGPLGSEGLIETLRRAWEARPDLWHAWSALVAETAHLGRLDEAESLARRAVERFPLLPRVHLDLASVLRARDDAEGERAALRRAVQISPSWGQAACVLARSLERDELFEESRAVLERAVAHSPTDGVVNGHLADALRSLGEKAAARERMAVALRHEPSYDWAWRTYADWSKEDDEPDAAAELARELTRARPGDPRAWKALESLLGDDALDERLETLDRVAAITPRDLEVHDRKAEILAEAGRFDEALAACSPPIFGDRPPSVLRGRAAWVLHARGDRDEARERMRALVAENPEYGWAWRQLLEWSRHDDDPAEQLEAATQCVRLYGEDPSALVELGEARNRAGDRLGAREAFARAVAAAPGYDYARIELFDVELAVDNPVGASRALAPLIERGDYPAPAFVLAREVQLAAALRDKRRAVDALRRLCAAPAVESDWPWFAADAAMVAAKWARAARRVYEEALARPETPPAVGEVWAGRGGMLAAMRVGRKLRRMLASDGEPARRALRRHFGRLGENSYSWVLRRSLRRHRAAARVDAEAWAMAGHALRRAGRPRAALRWMADHATREDAEPWMMTTVALCLRTLRREGEARRIEREAAEAGGDSPHPWLGAWLAFEAAHDGDAEAADRWIAATDVNGLDHLHGYVLSLAATLRELDQADPDDRPTAARAAVGQIARLNRYYSIQAVDRPPALRAWRRAARRAAAPLPAWRRPLARLRMALSPPIYRPGA
ncbi:C39 family peptidase [Paludisphaera sp.]|uniref:C39 family peptidase n=1 Tax=Paludisphaera sp. TaxID=2017432 RepID=UPI00301D2FF6